jgi:aspartyl-tRNA(Asn)/glutamyl-tRNA(Gln) amidotransferase subunit C
MALTTEEVQHVAMLARIALEADQIESLRNELNFIFKHIDMIASLDLEHVEPMVHSVPMLNAMRDDVVKPSFSTEVAMHNAPAHEGTAFLVPRIVAPGGDA